MCRHTPLRLSATPITKGLLRPGDCRHVFEIDGIVPSLMQNKGDHAMTDEFIKKTYRFDRDSEKTVKKIMEEENRNRLNQGLSRISENDVIKEALRYYYEHVFDKDYRKREEEKDAQYYANITKKVTEKYYESIMGSLEAIAGGINSSSLLLRIIASKEDSLKSGTSEEKLVSRILKDDETFRKIRSIYNARKQDEDIYEDKGSGGDGEENRRLF